MLTELKKLEKLLQTIQKRLPKIVEKAVKDNDAFIIKLNKEQLLKAKLNDGSPTPRYKQTTLDMKMDDPKRSLRGSDLRYSLYDEGELYPAMFTIAKDYILTIGSTSDSTRFFDTWSKSVHGYGVERFFGLTEENELIVLKRIVENITEQISELINGVR